MSDEFNSENEGEGIASLRKQYEETKKALADAQKLVKDLSDDKRKKDLGEIFKAKSLPETAAQHFTGEVSEDAVVKWATDLGLLKPVEGTPPKEPLDANAQAAQRLSENSHGSYGFHVESEQTPGTRVLGDADEIMHALKTLPKEELQRLGLMPKDFNTV